MMRQTDWSVRSPRGSCDFRFRPARSSSGTYLRLTRSVARRREHYLDQAALRHEIPRNDLVTRRVGFEPTLAAPKKLLDFVISNPVVLLVVQHRNQDVQMREQFAQQPRRRRVTVKIRLGPSAGICSSSG